ncbi:hypothetical protein [Dactylosporangium sp. CS-033363]|uniref:hypothetical protein n=1 Tax=Dactylosporangium sp. CS-033363 TaxID=3239935 RepID=UPI003D8EE9A4
MRMTRRAWLAAACVLLVAGCGSKTEDAGTTAPATTTAATTKAAGAAEQLSAAAAKTAAAAYTFKAGDPATQGSIEGAIDPASSTSTSKLSVGLDDTGADAGTNLTVESLLVAGGYFVKISGLPIPGVDGSKWFRADPAKISQDNALGLGNAKDPIGLADMPASIAGVQSSDGRSFTGTLDLTKKAWGPLDDSALTSGLGDAAKAVPFTATVDAAGHLAQLTVNVPAYADSEASTTTVTFADFGKPVTATAPAAGDVIDAPATLYDVLNNQ